MRISEVISTIKAEILFKRTPIGRPINEYAIQFLSAAINDSKNIESDAIMCSNCCIIQSCLLVPSGCPNCGSKDLTVDIAKQNVL